MGKCLITGCEGFVGSCLADLLPENGIRFMEWSIYCFRG
jgi:nucleoside-diphosphate-sugar epimerase